ncbi:Plasmodium exported protein, unknown function [Plasmodium malariae]|uniref:Uncharacterized protein n=1 Tax=Plasmodium malariae TaxID=5858 RepID=A0A1D3TDF9_PLAMA|nr:Plasmodium exported protein, unknown function [Plasmodium malariae]SCP02929.1 Plasmodium exported protein, unknown function [Plasmodium malariae]
MKQYFKFLLFSVIFIFAVLIWIRCYKNNVNNYHKTLHKKYKLDNHLTVTINRLLSEDSIDSILNEYLSDNEGNNKLHVEGKDIYKSYGDNESEIEELIDNSIITDKGAKVATIKKSSFINRLDTYFEKKIFNQLDSIDKIKYRMKINRKAALKLIYKETALLFTPHLSLLFIGFILFISKISLIYKESSILKALSIVNSLVLGFVGLLILVGLFYVLVKIVKYKMMKANNYKLSYNELVSLVRNTFTME